MEHAFGATDPDTIAPTLDDGELPRSPSEPSPSGGNFPSKQMQNDEAEAPCDDQERKAVQRRQQRTPRSDAQARRRPASRVRSVRCSPEGVRALGESAMPGHA